MHKFSALSALAISLLCASSLSAAEYPLGYCNGDAAVDMKPKFTTVGEGGGAIGFMPADLLRLDGKKITKARCHIYDTKCMTELKLWVKRHLEDTDYLAVAPVESPQKGWNEVTFDSPVTINAQDSLYIGFTYRQQGICYALTYCSGQQFFDHDNYFFEGGGWEDYSDELRALCIEGIIDDPDIIDYDLGISALKVDSRFYRYGEKMNCSAIIRNFGSKFISKAKVEYTINGELVNTEEVNVNLPSGGWYALDGVQFKAPSATLPDAILQADPTISEEGISEPFEIYINVFDKMYDRRVVVEEGTGTWCSFCPRGIVGLRDMLAAHPDDFIPIAVHWNDEMAMNDYQAFMRFQSYPSSVIDRYIYDYDPNFAGLEVMYGKEKAFQTYADFSIDGGVFDDGTVDVNATLTFDYDNDDCDYRLIVVITEDNVSGFPQNNAYGNGAMGEMGGFEDLPSYIVDFNHMHVARAAYPSYGLDDCLVRRSVKAGEVYKYNYRFPVKDNVQDLDQLTANVLLVNGHDGTIINGRAMPLSGLGAIDSIVTDAELLSTEYYDISGRPMAQPEGLHLSISRYSDGKTVSKLNLAR